MKFSVFKRQARQYIAFSRPFPMTVAFAYAAAMAVFTFTTTQLIFGQFDLSSLAQYYQKFMEYVQSADVDSALNVTDKMLALYDDNLQSIPFYIWLICLVVYFIKRILTSGLTVYSLAAVHKNEPCFGNLLDGFSPRIIAIDLLTLIITALGYIFLVVPGSILFYAYRQAIYIAADCPEKGVIQCMRESRLAMRGHKFQLFKLDLSLIGWHILTNPNILGYTAFIGMIWAKPFIYFNYAIYYDELTERNISHEIDPPTPGDDGIDF